MVSKNVGLVPSEPLPQHRSEFNTGSINEVWFLGLNMILPAFSKWSASFLVSVSITP